MTHELLGVVKKAMESCNKFKKTMEFFSLIVMNNRV